ncbi:amidohydrolase [soil metagenome]
MFTFITLLAFAPAQPVAADAVFLNGKIWTGNAAQPEAAALATWHGLILKVGSNDDVKALIGPGTKTIDLANRRVVPGFYDSHVHFLGGGRSLNQVDLKDAKDEAEFAKRLKEWDTKTTKSRWLLGGNWDHDRTFAGKLPTAATVDVVIKDRPVFISRYDGHMALVNSVALKLAGIDAKTKDPAGGVIERNADGSPSGILKDNAMSLVDKLIPEPDDEEIRESIQAAMNACAAAGITSIQDMDGSSPDTRVKLFRRLQSLSRQSRLSVRIDLRWPIAAWQDLAKLGTTANFGSDMVRIGGVKGFMDGSLGSSTAKMAAPFDSDAKTSGVYVTEPAVMKRLVKQAHDARLSVAVHAIGDEANHQLLAIFAEHYDEFFPAPRFRIEHAQHLKPDDIGTFRTIGVIASMQPYHVIDDGRWAEGRIGKKRCESSYAFRSLLDEKAILAFGSDWPVAPLNVLEGIDAAVNRRTLDGKNPNGWFPQQRITVAEAVKAYTWGSAYAANQEKEKGTLEAGKFADLVVLDTDIFDPKNNDAIAKTKVELTVVNGMIVFEKKSR